MTTPATAVAIRAEGRLIAPLRPIAEPTELLKVQEETRTAIMKILKKDRDYGLIKGTERETLYKSGAERCLLAFGCVATFRIMESEIDHHLEVHYTDKYGKPKTSLGIYRYVVECQITQRETGMVVGAFVGAASTLEKKYISRPRDCENTIIKMSEKRALVGAVLVAFGLSDQFTQDVEDLPTGVIEGKEEEHEDQPETLTRDSVVNWGQLAKDPKKVRDLHVAYLRWATDAPRAFGPRTDEWTKLFRAELDLRELEKDQKREDPKPDQAPVTDTPAALASAGAVADALERPLAADDEELADDLPF